MLPIVAALSRRATASPSSDALLADWIARSTAAGVTFKTDFSGANDFVLATTNGGHVFGGNDDPTIWARVVKDTTDGLTNGCCLRIDTPAAVGTNSADWMFPFDSSWTSNSQRWPLDTDLWMQFRFKIPSSRLVLSNCGGNQRGWKWMNIACYSKTNTDSQSYSNVTAEIVLQDTDQLGLPQAYHQDGNSFPPFSANQGGSPTKQSGIDRGAGFSGGNRYCYTPGTPACFFWPTDEWITFQLRIKIHQYGGDPVTAIGTTGNEFDLWVARRGDSSWLQLELERGFVLGDLGSTALAAGFTGLNGGHLLTYESQRINSTVDTYHKYDQLIVSTNQPAIPVG